MQPKPITFRKLQTIYKLKHPEEIKLHILWYHIQQLMKVAYPGADTERILKVYDLHWRICEKKERGR